MYGNVQSIPGGGVRIIVITGGGVTGMPDINMQRMDLRGYESVSEAFERRLREDRVMLRLREMHSSEDRMSCQAHRMPPVPIELASEPALVPPVRTRLRSRPWVRWGLGRPRERASHRRRLRAWER